MRNPLRGAATTGDHHGQALSEAPKSPGRDYLGTRDPDMNSMRHGQSDAKLHRLDIVDGVRNVIASAP
jgi:hypothetical protein